MNGGETISSRRTTEKLVFSQPRLGGGSKIPEAEKHRSRSAGAPRRRALRRKTGAKQLPMSTVRKVLSLPVHQEIGFATKFLESEAQVSGLRGVEV
jgi:hypothetical protein